MAYKDKTIEHVRVGLASKSAAEDLLGTAFTQDSLEFIGKGQGGSKTTTSIYGNTITEDFGIGDENFLHWQIPRLAEFDNKFELHFEFAPTTAEVGKTVSFQVSISRQGEGTDISNSETNFVLADQSVPVSAFQSFSLSLELPEFYVKEEFDDLHIKITRISGTNDLIGDIAMHHASMEYYKYQK